MNDVGREDVADGGPGAVLIPAVARAWRNDEPFWIGCCDVDES